MEYYEKEIQFLTVLCENLANTISQILSITGNEISPDYIISQYSEVLSGTTAVEDCLIRQGKLTKEKALENHLENFILNTIKSEVYNNDT